MELLIVIVVIGVLAAITVVAFNNVQIRARDGVRQSDTKQIVKALELYYVENGRYPNVTNYTPGSTAINPSWSTTADSSWANLAAVLEPYASALPSPPGAASTVPAISGGNSYDYFGFSDGGYCNSSAGQGFLLVVRREGNQVDTLGACPGTPLPPYGSASNYRVVK